MDDTKLLAKALSSCKGNKSHMAAKLNVSRQVVQGWIRKSRLPSWRRDAVHKLVGK